ncbi:porin [Duganella violaceipulchra]|uniref:Porin n=1 Tax=Duganella violaceipulchra TaxID=2849652 RepID=A0AA41L7R5_9BURK|nr:porin [Duganella violaceicalia]MBV6324612.1 porin [Duganella violaceicalia]MCP2009943.1 putative porin [Duganella violaceicalia]
MKPSLYVLFLTCPLSVAAQTASPVQVYGLLDAGVVAERGCGGACAPARLDSGIASGSRLGVRGREELGGGTAAVYTLEAGILNDSGASDQNGKLFGRQAYVGLDGPLGMLTLGRQYNLVYETLIDVADPFHGGMAGNAANLVGTTTQRYDNTIKYQSPRSRGGWTGAAIYSFGESPYNSKVNRAYGATIGYANGAATLRITHQRKDNLLDADGTTPAVDQSASNTLVAANLDFGRFVGYAAYGHSRGNGSSPWDMSNPYGAVVQSMPSNNSRDVLVGIAVPMGATTWLASYIHKDDRSAANRDANQIAVGASYALSRRTDFYASFARIQNRNGAGYTVGNASAPGHGDRAITIGLRHSF